MEKNFVENALEVSLTAINATVTHAECRAALTAMLCHYAMPPCHANNNVTQFCLNECKELFSKCGYLMERAMNIIPGGIKSELSLPGCFGLNNTYETEEKNGTCIKLGLSK